jgi:hypothetical protein
MLVDIANAIRPFAVLNSTQAREQEVRKLWTEAGKWYKAVGITAQVKEGNRRVRSCG